MEVYNQHVKESWRFCWRKARVGHLFAQLFLVTDDFRRKQLIFEGMMFQVFLNGAMIDYSPHSKEIKIRIANEIPVFSSEVNYSQKASNIARRNFTVV